MKGIELMRRYLTVLIAFCLMISSLTIAAADKADEEKLVCEKIESYLSGYLDASKGDWLAVYYSKEDNTFYAYADVYLARYGAACQYQDSDPAIYTLMKFYLFQAQSLSRFAVWLSENFKDAKLVMAYVTNGRLDDYTEYCVTKNFAEEYASVKDKPCVLYSLTMSDCSKDEIEVYDLFFGDDKPITITEASPYLN